MTDTQILTIALSSVPTTLAVLIGILLNNAAPPRRSGPGRPPETHRRAL